MQIHDFIRELLDTLFQRAGEILAEADSFPAFGAVLLKDGSLEPVVSEHATERGLESIVPIQKALEAAASRPNVRGFGICLCDCRDASDVKTVSSNVVIVIETSEQALRAVIPYERQGNGNVVFSEPQYTMDRIGILSDS